MPPSNDTDTAAFVIFAALASCRCPTDTHTTCNPGLAEPPSPSPSTPYRSVIGSTAHAVSSCPFGRQVHPSGSLPPDSCAERQVHTVWLRVDSAPIAADAEVLRANLITDGDGLSRAAAVNAPPKSVSEPPAILFPFCSIW
ncbi:MAG TPA: hypothetical protein VGI74_23605 [Streptosporangiaceae bacterium]